MIRSYRGKYVAAVAAGRAPKGFPANLIRASQRKLVMLEAAEQLSDLRTPPGNRLEALAGDRVGHHSIRINDQWRICFRWTDLGPEDVDITDYH